MITIHLDPRVAAHLEMPAKFTAHATTALEAVACLRSNWPQFGQWMLKAVQTGACFSVVVGNQQIEEKQVSHPIEPKVRSLRITLVPSGSGGGGGFLKIIAGAALLGLGIAGVGFLGLAAKTLGASLLFQGISSFFGRVKDPASDEADGKQSLIFGSPKQTVAEGGRVPCVYGLHLIGLNIISAQIQTAYTPA